ncbi:hypothetical protein BUALT_Bualt13G0046100 [Buddleja alternifolia]|uniref:C2H2-type domain-containing protein n=1 Tax=Buddleja alternifolia TaxID=168488 RepID=A0AAV6WQ52_9LAMI|nr:hypothetical protein BUALT_Bualt13G0046100 [Buddleja alternifolia]
MKAQGDNVNEVGGVKSKKRKRDSSLRICDPEAIIDPNFPSKDNESNSTINNDLMNVEQLEGIKCGVQHELLMNGDKLKGAKCNTEIQKNCATGGGAESGMELEEREIEVEKDEELEEGEIEVQNDEQLEEGEIEQLEGEIKKTTREKTFATFVTGVSLLIKHSEATDLVTTSSRSALSTPMKTREPNQEQQLINEENSLHLCNICNKNFPSGQALRGHKRCYAYQGACPSSSHMVKMKRVLKRHRKWSFLILTRCQTRKMKMYNDKNL